ncbi:MAG: aminotransferase class V-fold PLP-dependent enzyme [Pseudobutyrivibrio ruminis]|nr:aminotransferase class V-fold PLP-dependent enzyme [Pseudobutyrivibrio ruminis]
MIYLDNAATTFPKSESMLARMDEVNRNLAVNAGRGSYKAARQADEIIANTREKLLRLANANGVADIFFTSSATIAFNQIIGGIEWKNTDVVYVSPFEHNAVMRTLHFWQKKFEFSIQVLPYKSEVAGNNKYHFIDLDAVKFQFAKNKPDYVFMSYVSNVTGYILPIEKIGTLAKSVGGKVIVDGAQAFGLVPVNFKTMPIDLLVFAGHKTLYGPFGVAGFIKTKEFSLSQIFAGGTGSDSLNLDMPNTGSSRYEVGSENIVAIAGLEAALDELVQANVYENEKELTKLLTTGLQGIKNVYTYLPSEDSHIGIVSFNIGGYMASEVGQIMDEDFDIAVRTGYHCAPLIHDYINDKSFVGTVRASVGKFTTEKDIKLFLQAIQELTEEV